MLEPEPRENGSHFTFSEDCEASVALSFNEVSGELSSLHFFRKFLQYDM